MNSLKVSINLWFLRRIHLTRWWQVIDRYLLRLWVLSPQLHPSPPAASAWPPPAPTDAGLSEMTYTKINTYCSRGTLTSMLQRRHTQTCALCSLRSSSCLACLCTALCTRRVSLALSSSSVSALWKSVVQKLMLEGSGNTTQTPTTSDGHDDTGVAALVGSSGKTLRFY